MQMLKKITTLSLIAVFICTLAYASEETLQKQIDELKKELRDMSSYYESKIEDLEKRIEGQERKEADPDHDHDEHDDGHAEHEHERKNLHEPPGHGHHHGILGDKVSIIGALDGRYVNVEENKNVLMLHEAKIGAQAYITDWLYGYITVVKHHGEEVHIEEAYGILSYDEWRIAAKPGKFFVNFGPENLAHFFDRRTITLSPMHEGLFGGEPWADTGVQFDWRLPVEFYSNMSFSVLNRNNAESFGNGTSTVSNNNLPLSFNWTNAFETENSLLRFGPSLAWGKWDTEDRFNVYLAGGDVYYKLGNFDAQFELIYRWKEMPDIQAEEDAYGYYMWGAYTFPLDYKYLQGIEFLAGFSQFMPDMGERETRFTPQVSLLFIHRRRDHTAQNDMHRMEEIK